MRFCFLTIGLSISYLFVCYWTYANATPTKENSQLQNNIEQKKEDENNKKRILTAEQVAQTLNLEGHIEGGYFRRTYESNQQEKIKTPDGERFLMTSIYYLLTNASPVGKWHLNKSDIIHYYHLGDTIEYSLIYPDATLKKIVMGGNIQNHEKLQLIVPGGVWKSSRLLTNKHGYGLISEAVTPGFDYNDMTLGDCETLSKLFPQHKTLFCPEQ